MVVDALKCSQEVARHIVADEKINIMTHMCESVTFIAVWCRTFRLRFGFFTDCLVGKDRDCVRGRKKAGSAFGASANIVRVYARSQPSAR